MHAVLDLQTCILHDAVEEEGIKRDAIGLGEFWIDRIEAIGIFTAHVRWCQHADQKHADTARLQLLEHRHQILAALLGRNSAQRIVGAEFEDNTLGAIRNGPVDAGKTARCGIAGNAGIGDGHVMALVAQGLLQPRGERVVRRQLIAGHQAVAEADDLDGRGLKRAHRDQTCESSQEKRPETFHSHQAAPKSGCEQLQHNPYIGRTSVAKTMIELKNADLTLGQAAASVHVLKGMSLDIDAGQSVGIVGPSGSGKSTLLMVLAGLERLDKGEIVIDGTPLQGLSEDRVADFRGRNIGIVFQSFHLIPNMTALENVAVPLELANVRDAFDIARRELISVGLGERLSHYPGQLSGGEQQRVAIARALAPAPKLLIADEPTGNLDTETGRQIADLIFSKQAERNMTLILVTHDNSLAARCSRQIKVRSGTIVDDGRSVADLAPSAVSA